MLLPLPTPQEMAVWDRETIDSIGIPGVTLMESASRSAVDVLLEEWGSVDGTEIACFAGSGNNGGDAFAMARHLLDLGADVTVYHTKPKKMYRGETRSNLIWAQKTGVPLKHLAGIDTEAIPQPDIIVDGLLGTGFEGELREDYLALIRTINHMGRHAFILSVDIPSGLNGLTGTPQPEAVKADVTATFQAPKLGLAMPGASRYSGLLHVCTIGIPNLVQENHPASHNLICGDCMDLISEPTHDMHKGSAGHVLVIGGSTGLTGAPHLSALGALRSGAGLVTIACPGGLADTIKAGSPDIMTLPLGQGDIWDQSMPNALLEEMDRFNAIVLGPGMGRDSATIEFLRSLLVNAPNNMVLDADGLYALSRFPELLERLPETTILTPHPGEMARLLRVSNSEIQSDRLNAARLLKDKTEATLILKGAGTIVADTTAICLSPFSEPNLAVGGSGDVLSGVIGSLLSRGLEPLAAACTGVYWHGLAGRLLKEDYPSRGNLASDIAHVLPSAAKHHAQEV